MDLKEANLLAATEDYIVQQCCCTGCRPHGLSQALATMFPHANPYKLRLPIKKGGNTARQEDRATPGTVVLLGNGEDQRYVACLFAQYAMGKPGKYEAFGVSDSAKDRERYFADSLESLATAIPEGSSLAFPYGIGCGLAGGSWPKYEALLRDWLCKHPSFRVTLYKI